MEYSFLTKDAGDKYGDYGVNGIVLHLFRGDTPDVLPFPTYVDDKMVVGVSLQFTFSNNLRQVILPDTVKRLAWLRFEICPSFEEIVFTEKLKEIDDIIFTNCESITEFILPENVERIDKLFIYDCDKIKSIIALNDNIHCNEIKIKNCVALEEISFCLWGSLEQDMLLKILSKKFDVWSDLQLDEQDKIRDFIQDTPYVAKLLSQSDCVLAVPALIDLKVPIDLHYIDHLLQLSIEQKNTLINAMLLDYKNTNFTQVEIDEYNQQKEEHESGFRLPNLFQLSDSWDFEERDDGIYIKSYKGSSDVAIIPEGTIDGKMIVGIECHYDKNFHKKFNYNFIKKLIINAKIEILNYELFEYSILEEIILPDSVVEIGDSCFSDCSLLKEIELPNSVTHIQDSAFFNCEKLTKINIPDNIEYIGDASFSGCNSLKEIVIPNSIRVINFETFYNCASLSKITFSDNLTDIFNEAFVNCFSLEEIVFPASLKSIGSGAFENCFNLKSVVFNSVVRYDHTAFNDCPVTFYHNDDDDYDDYDI